MARRRKNRTHNKGNATAKTSNGISGDPKSFVIKHGAVGYSIAQLVRDMRKVMEPNTATRLRVRNFATLFLSHVISDLSHRSELGTS
jgi:ribosome biogenesis protein SSF1/2